MCGGCLNCRVDGRWIVIVHGGHGGRPFLCNSVMLKLTKTPRCVRARARVLLRFHFLSTLADKHFHLLTDRLHIPVRRPCILLFLSAGCQQKQRQCDPRACESVHYEHVCAPSSRPERPLCEWRQGIVICTLIPLYTAPSGGAAGIELARQCKCSGGGLHACNICPFG